MNTSAPLLVSPQQIAATSATRDGVGGLRLGTLTQTRDGRKFVLCKNGALALASATLAQAPVQVAALQNAAPTDTGVGALAIRVTPTGAITLAENALEGGWLVINAGPGIGQQLGVHASPAVAASAAPFDVVLESDDAVRIALTAAASKVDLMGNPYRDAIVAPVALTGTPLGVAACPVPANEYFWAQVSGPCAVLIDGTPAVGQALSPSTAVAGALAINATTGPIIGTAMVTGVTGRVQLVMLNIRG